MSFAVEIAAWMIIFSFVVKFLARLRLEYHRSVVRAARAKEKQEAARK